jgi:hypothetical protein
MTAQTTPRHRVSAATAQMRAAADAVVDASVWSMDVAETGQTLIELSLLKAQVAELESRVAAHADDLHVGQDVAASSAANWLAHETRQTRAQTNRTVRLGHDLETHTLTREALAAGAVCEEQARVVVQAVDRLPTEHQQRGEAHLLAEAEHHDAKALRILGKRLYEVVDPDAADAHEAQLLEREEAAAAKTTELRMWDDGHGKTHLRGTIPTFHGTALRKMLQAIAAPRHQRATHGAGAELPTGPEAMGQAFCTLVERYPHTLLPKLGSLNATLLVTIDADSLMGRVEKAGTLDTGDRISPALARRLACEAGIIPLVMSGDSMSLDVGRKKRLHPEYQCYAILTRDQRCRAEGCDRTSGLHIHHDTRWTDGGDTTVDQGVALCPWHHSRVHDTRYEAIRGPTGRIQFHRRT